MSINITYIQSQLDKKVQIIAPVSSIQEIHHNPFKKQNNNTSHQKNLSFQTVLDERIKVYQKDARK